MVATLATPIALKIAEVLLPLPLAEAFDYAVPAEMELSVGDLVAVPLGPRTVMGVVTAMRDGAGTNRALRPVAERLAAGAIGETTLAFVRWAARYAVDAPGEALAITLRGRR
ncbi:MAG: primosomal protein N', partial [Caulobacteraceae bacterium]